MILEKIIKALTTLLVADQKIIHAHWNSSDETCILRILPGYQKSFLCKIPFYIPGQYSKKSPECLDSWYILDTEFSSFQILSHLSAQWLIYKLFEVLYIEQCYWGFLPSFELKIILVLGLPGSLKQIDDWKHSYGSVIYLSCMFGESVLLTTGLNHFLFSSPFYETFGWQVIVQAHSYTTLKLLSLGSRGNWL